MAAGLHHVSCICLKIHEIKMFFHLFTKTEELWCRSDFLITCLMRLNVFYSWSVKWKSLRMKSPLNDLSKVLSLLQTVDSIKRNFLDVKTSNLLTRFWRIKLCSHTLKSSVRLPFSLENADLMSLFDSVKITKACRNLLKSPMILLYRFWCSPVVTARRF